MIIIQINGIGLNGNFWFKYNLIRVEGLLYWGYAYEFKVDDVYENLPILKVSAPDIFTKNMFPYQEGDLEKLTWQTASATE